jgi:hypothetical protein
MRCVNKVEVMEHRKTNEKNEEHWKGKHVLWLLSHKTKIYLLIYIKILVIIVWNKNKNPE